VWGGRELASGEWELVSGEWELASAGQPFLVPARDRPCWIAARWGGVSDKLEKRQLMAVWTAYAARYTKGPAYGREKSPSLGTRAEGCPADGALPVATSFMTFSIP
jgi:hypothetical protein